ncbi:9912_t:CDS:1 [Paraglomus brasilianum]|uniref:9912_t:CDS:1 n=1 Tax=Paraglomus brasilianum TaxID=144538 RepID=A0A9N8VZT0_9GLOM|nr:9912_t:CDS:1 [Paraglomus brasilianum]
MSIIQFPLELLQQIFLLADNPRFVKVCRTFRDAINAYPSLKIQWLLQRHGNDCQRALEEGQRWGFFDVTILQQLDATNYQRLLKAGKRNPPKQLLFTKRPLATRLFKEDDRDGRNYDLVKTLLERGALPDYPNGYPMVKSIQKGNAKMVKLLLDYNAKIDKLALTLIVNLNNYEIAKLLLEKGVAADGELLAMAAKKNNGRMMDLLKKYGAEPDKILMNHYDENPSYILHKHSLS